MKSSNRCRNCQASLDRPCVRAQERIREIQITQAGGKVEPSTLGCDWYINSQYYNYSFHEMLKDLDGNPLSDREICKLLMISQTELNAIFESAINKLKAIKDTDVLQDLKELVAERGDPNDNTIYMPDEIHKETAAKDLEDKKQIEKDLEPKKRGPKKKLDGMGMPVHHSGKRTDLYFRGKNTLSRMSEDRKNIKRKRDEEK